MKNTFASSRSRHLSLSLRHFLSHAVGVVRCRFGCVLFSLLLLLISCEFFFSILLHFSFIVLIARALTVLSIALDFVFIWLCPRIHIRLLLSLSLSVSSIYIYIQNTLPCNRLLSPHSCCWWYLMPRVHRTGSFCHLIKFSWCSFALYARSTLSILVVIISLFFFFFVFVSHRCRSRCCCPSCSVCVCCCHCAKRFLLSCTLCFFFGIQDFNLLPRV